MNVPADWWLLAENAAWAGVAALGFAVLFNVPVRTLFGCALSGATAYAIRTLLTESGMAGIEAATLVGAISVAFMGVALGRIWHVPAPVFIIPGVIPMIPGSLAFKTMIGILELVTSDSGIDQTLFVETAVNTMKTMLIVGAIASGIAVPRLLLRRHRPMT